MKVSELTGKDLDTWVAKAQGWEEQYIGYNDDGVAVWVSQQPVYKEFVEDYTPSTNSGQCFDLMKLDSFRWVESLRGEYSAMFNQLDKTVVVTCGPTLNIAICRAFVASVYGDEVSDEQL